MARPKKVAPAPDSAGEAPLASGQSEKNTSEVTIYPLRSYMDGGEIKRRGGPGYTVARRHADVMVAQGLAATEKPRN